MQSLVYIFVLLLTSYLIFVIIKSLLKTVVVVLLIVVMVILLRSLNTPVRILNYVIEGFTITKIEGNK